MMEDSDAAVIEQVRAGDTEAFRVLVERHSHAVFGLAYGRTGNERDAEGAVRETILYPDGRRSMYRVTQGIQDCQRQGSHWRRADV